jgi:adenylate cyclase
MGDCVMAFWGAPVQTPHHAALVIKSALEMTRALHEINQNHRAKGLPEIGMGIGINTGLMCVGDMGSNIRRSYTVIGDAVNLGSRLEGLSKIYGVEIVVSEHTRALAPDFLWQELDFVRVKGKAEAVRIFTPLTAADDNDRIQQTDELSRWHAFLHFYRTQQWQQALDQLQQFLQAQPRAPLYGLYLERIMVLRAQPHDPSWDGITQFDSK